MPEMIINKGGGKTYNFSFHNQNSCNPGQIEQKNHNWEDVVQVERCRVEPIPARYDSWRKYRPQLLLPGSTPDHRVNEQVSLLSDAPFEQ